MPPVDQNAFENLVGCRDLLAFTLTDQTRPPEDLVEPIANLVALLNRRVEELKIEHGFPNPDRTIYDPLLVARFDGATYTVGRTHDGDE